MKKKEIVIENQLVVFLIALGLAFFVIVLFMLGQKAAGLF
jgi:hypothetical protein